ncbi:CAP-Gly domain-containing linker protein 1-like isoform X2 [Salvia splendens]|uniref:CAP-Gly domain-containing linker protein 1-like isoform X2 n=1 Tax=Salvia splendens TaxID=180675 RepID=UPI001C26AD7A|nr:CAP-Gly domain-containing linker protein 1-like isoform X2 [Salvia splendens]
MAETEVSNVASKMVAIEEICGLDMSSNQDLLKPDSNGNNHHNQANDLDHSYIFVTGADGLPDDTLDDKGVAIGGSSVPPPPEDSQYKKVGEFCEEAPHLIEGENGEVEPSNGHSHLVNYITCNHESSHENGQGVQVSVTDSGEVNANKIESSLEAEVELVDSDGISESLAKAEGFHVSVADPQEVHTGKPGSAAEATVKQVEDSISNGISESMPEAEVVKAVDQNRGIEAVEDGEQENVDGVKIAESPRVVENQETQVGALELVAEVEENGESRTNFSNINGSHSPDDGENQSNTSVTEALVQQSSQDMVVDEDKHDLQNVSMEAENDAKPTSEAAEHEVPTSTSLGLDSEPFSVHNMNKILEEEAKTDLSSDVLENQQGDDSGFSNIAQDMVGETDDLKPVVSSTDSHVQTTRDLVLEENNEDLPVLEVDNGPQYHEESQELLAVCNADSQMLTICDLVLDEKNEESSVPEVEQVAKCDEKSEEESVVSSTASQVPNSQDMVLEEKNEYSSVSEVEDGIQYHEEYQAQPVKSSSGSQVLITHDLVLKEKNEVSSESEVEDGIQCHEESQEQPVVSSSDSHDETTSDLVIEGKKEDLPVSVSEVEDGIQCHEESQEQPVVSSSDSHDETASDLVLDGKENDLSVSVSEVDSGAQNTKDSQEQPDVSGVSDDTLPSETSTQVSGQTESYPTADVHAPQSELKVSDVAEIGKFSSPSVVGLESQIIEQVVPAHDSGIRCTVEEASSGSDGVLDMVGPEKEIAFEGGEAHSESTVSSGKSEVGDSSPETLDVKLEPDGHVPDFSAINSGEKIDDVTVSCRTDNSDSCNARVVNLELEVDGVQNVADQLAGAPENLLVQEKENTENSQNEETSVSSAGVSTTSTTVVEDKSIKTKPFNFLIRTPRFDDESLREQIRLAKLQVDETTKLRDAVQLKIQEKRANTQIHGIDYEYAKSEGRNARKLVRSKRTEIDSLQSVINKAKNALSIEDIDKQIHNMEHMIQHETLPLKEEKQFIREIKQLKQLREQLSSNMGSQDEIKKALEQREETEERLKILRKELDVLKSRVVKAEATAVEAGKKYDDENRKVKELQAQFRAANDVRQEAYAQWQDLRKELTKKSKYFFKYKDAAAVASNYAYSRDTEALYLLCMNQVESFMELWNTNPEFRSDYAKFNARSNVRRFGTLDCRSLGPDEVPPVLPSYANERGNKRVAVSTPAKVDLAPQDPTMELNQKIPTEKMTVDSKSIKKVTEPKNQKIVNAPAVTVQENGPDTHTVSHLADEEPVKSREEIELIRKAEELRREEDAAKLKEQCRLEALAKANEARERKKRQAEKMQQRAELKTQKEAEQREKEREKRLRKKERKKAVGTDANDITNNNCETAASSESAAENNSKDVDVKETTTATTKKAQKPWLAAKHSKGKSIPPPLRNRNKKKLQQWMWVGITSIIILVLFWLGNMGMFSNVALKRRAPVY